MKKNSSKGHTKLTILLLIIVIGMTTGIGVKVGMDWQENKINKNNHVQAITSDVLRQQMETIGELATVKYYYTNMGKYEDNLKVMEHDVPFTKKSFTISYDGVIKAGIELKEIQIQVEDSTIRVILPAPKILAHEVDMDSVTVYDEKSSIFNGLATEDVTGFLKDQNSLMEEKAKNSGIYQDASDNAASALTYLFQTFLNSNGQQNEYTLDIQKREQTNATDSDYDLEK